MRANNLTQGKILQHMITLAIPIMATGFIQMSYQLMDMFWLGQGSTDWVAAAGMAGFAVWIATALVLIPRIGIEIGVGQAIGAENEREKRRYIQGGLFIALVISIAYSLISIVFAYPMISFFGIDTADVNQMGVDYLRFVSLGHPFTFLNAVLTGILTAGGDSKTPFIYNTVGLVTNILLDPIMIFVFHLGVVGAAVATVLAQGLISSLFIFKVMRYHPLFNQVFAQKDIQRREINRIVRWGLPSSLQSIFFAVSSAIVSRFVASYGAGPFAAYNVGVQIESIGWLSMSGFSGALTAFVAQNYGARQFERVREGLKKSTWIGMAVGLFAMIVLLLFAEPFMSLFVGDDEIALKAGALYLVIIAYAQIPMSLDFTATGVFQGVGNTLIPSAGGITGNAIRIVLAMVLNEYFGLAGIFISIAVTCALKGFALYPWIWSYLKKRTPHCNVSSESGNF